MYVICTFQPSNEQQITDGGKIVGNKINRLFSFQQRLLTVEIAAGNEDKFP